MIGKIIKRGGKKWLILIKAIYCSAHYGQALNHMQMPVAGRPAGHDKNCGGNELFCSFNCLGLSFSCCAFEGNNNLDKRDIRSYIYYWVGDCIYVVALVDYSYTVKSFTKKRKKPHQKRTPSRSFFAIKQKIPFLGGSLSTTLVSSAFLCCIKCFRHDIDRRRYYPCTSIVFL